MTMLEIQNTVVSLDLLTEHFVCDYAACKGICCKEGDSGAPSTEYIEILINYVERNFNRT